MIGSWTSARAGERAGVCVVGAGPAGLTLALELGRLGRDALVLESGREKPGAAQELARADIVDPRRHDDMSIATARRLGGASNLWGGRCMPLEPVDFAPREFSQNARWPLAFEELAAFYPPACGYADCGAPVFERALPGFSAPETFAFDHIERASNKPKFQKAHARELALSRRIDLRLGASVVDLEFDAGGRVVAALVADGAGEVARQEADVFVLACGGVETARLLLWSRRARPDRFGGADGPLGRYYMGHVIGEIADVTFADPAFEAGFDFFRDGAGSWARRRFTPSAQAMAADNLPNVAFWPVVPPIADPRHGSGALSAVALALSTPVLGKALIPEAIRARHLDGPVAWGPHLRNVLADAPATAAFLARFVHARYLSRERVSGYFQRNRARRYGLSYHAEQSPRADSRVTLADEKDAFGMARARIDLRFSREDSAALWRAHERFARWFEGAGFGTVEWRQPEEEGEGAIADKMAHGTHQIGLARMGANRNEGVVDADLATFDAPNLHIASSAVFPTSGQANPTLTIVAFAVRLARRLAARPAT